MDEEKDQDAGQHDPAEEQPATGERSDHQVSPPGVEIPPEDEPEPGEHPAP